MERRILAVGGDRRQTWLAELLRQQGEVRTLRVPDLPDTAEPGPCDLLILPCPALDRDGRIHTAGEGLDPGRLIDYVNQKTRVFGGALASLRPLLEPVCASVADLLEEPETVAANARLTAEAALLLTQTETESSFLNRSCAILGWGRIAKCLASLLRGHGAEVLISVRRPEALAEAGSLGFPVCPLSDYLCREELIFNTIPARVLLPRQLEGASGLWIELASAPGGLPELPPLRALPAGGLPGRFLPRSAAEVLYRGILRTLKRSSDRTLT